MRIIIPIKDIKNRTVAKAMMIINIKEQASKSEHFILMITIIIICICILLVVFFFYLITIIGKRIERDENQLIRIATHDTLTQLYNHGTFYNLFNSEVERCIRYNHPLSLLMIDIDHFKHVNDTYGHQAGDIVLKLLSRLLIKEARKTDFVCRYGGEEITVIMPETNQLDALKLAERLRSSVESFVFKISAKKNVHITISIGASFFSKENNTTTTESLISAADTALYEAKNSGRNRVAH